MKPKISIAMATYNGARYLREQLDSFAAQHLLPDELVVCDDCSTDQTVAILNEFAATAPFAVQVHTNPRNLGYIANFGRALSLTTGDLIFLSDQDDVWQAEKLAVFERKAAAEPATLYFACDSQLCDGALNPGVRLSENFRRIGARPETGAAGSCTAIRRELLGLVLPMPDIDFPHDKWITALACAIGRWTYIDRPLQLFRRHGGNTSSGSVAELHGISFTWRVKDMVESSLRDPVPPWQESLMHLDRLHARLGERGAAIEAMIGGAAAQAACDAIEAEMASVRARIALVRRARPGRILDVLRHYRSGGYVRHRAHVSALKDILSPTSPVRA